jgi:hypothetical protein
VRARPASGGLLRLGVAALELLHAARGVHDLLLARVEQWDSEDTSTLTTGYSWPSLHFMVSRPFTSIAERDRKEWFEPVSRKITGV